MSDKKNLCKNCIHWNNRQRLLNYSENDGACLNRQFAFNISVGRLVGVVDTGNLKDQQKVSGNPSHDFETGSHMNIQFSRYILQTNENFGCNYFLKR